MKQRTDEIVKIYDKSLLQVLGDVLSDYEVKEKKIPLYIDPNNPDNKPWIGGKWQPPKWLQEAKKRSEYLNPDHPDFDKWKKKLEEEEATQAE